MSIETIQEASSVLVADDASIMRESLREILRHSTYHVVGEASDGIEVVEQFDRLRPDVVALDLVMPGRSGIHALRDILDLAPTTRVVMCSALGQETLVAEALHEGATGFIVTPFCPNRPLRTLDRVTDRVRTPEIAPIVRALGAARPAVDRATTSARCILAALRTALDWERRPAA